MKKIFTILILSLLIVSCHQKGSESNLDDLQENFNLWWSYYNQNIRLSSSFIALNSVSKKIEKSEFLDSLKTGEFIPIKSSDNTYQLLKLDKTAKPEISTTMKNAAQIEYGNYKMENQSFPAFHFQDLKNNEYDYKKLSNKTLIIKCWFIHCQQCVAEMSELNELVRQNKQNKNIIFFSLASDSADDLNQFLRKKEFLYPTISVPKSYFSGTLQINIFPTHFIVKNGKILKVVNNVKELKLAMNELL